MADENEEKEEAKPPCDFSIPNDELPQEVRYRKSAYLVNCGSSVEHVATACNVVRTTLTYRLETGQAAEKDFVK